MKDITIFLHASEQEDPTSPKAWIPTFLQNLTDSLEKYDVTVNSITSSKEEFLSTIKSGSIGCYLPVLDNAFINTSEHDSLFKTILEEIENNFSTQAFHLSLIEEVLPINHADYLPFYNFYNQGQSTLDSAKRFQEKHLPGNNNATSLGYHIEHISKEISYHISSLFANRIQMPKVFIGSATSDLTGPVMSLSNFLLEKNIDVVKPVKPVGIGKDFLEKKINTAIEQSWLCIHPLGSGALNSDLFLTNDVSICELENSASSRCFQQNQLNVLKDKNFKRIIWIPRIASPSTYEGRMIERIKNQSAKNQDAEILDCSLDELKEIILSYHQDLIENDGYFEDPEDVSLNMENENSLISSSNSLEKSVLVLCENSYQKDLDNLKSVLSENQLNMITLKDLENKGDFSKAKNETLQKCLGVIFLSSNWNTLWFKSNVNEVIKAGASRSSQNILCVLSREIDQIPIKLSDHLILMRINGSITDDTIRRLLIQNTNKIT